MRLIVQIWMLLALLVVERNFVKAADEEGVMYIDGGSGEGPVPQGGETPDDEDNTEAPAEMGSGTDKPASKSAPLVKPTFDNTIRITRIGNRRANFIPEYKNPNSAESMEVFGQVCNVLTNTLQQNQLTSMAESCVGVSIKAGSLIVKTKITFPEDAAVAPTDVETAIQDGMNGQALSDGSTTLSVDPASISVEPSSTEPEPTDGETAVPATKKPKPVKPAPATERPNKGNQDNDIFFPSTMTAKPQPGDSKTTMSNDLNGLNDAGNNNKLNVKDEKEKDQGFFKMILNNPVLLAALVGAVVLTLITIILIIMFMIYRVKKKDEGSYSLDEPHKVKDPTTYWKDTKEFYA